MGADRFKIPELLFQPVSRQGTKWGRSTWSRHSSCPWCMAATVWLQMKDGSIVSLFIPSPLPCSTSSRTMMA